MAAETVPYLDLNLKHIRLMGVWPDRSVAGRLSWRAGYLLLMYQLLFLACAWQLAVAYNDLAIVTECLTTFITFTSTFHKFLAIFMYEKDLKYLIHLIKQSFHAPDQRTNTVYCNILMKLEKESKILTYLFTISLMVTANFLNIFPMAQVLFDKEDVNGTTSYEWRFPFRMIIPLDTSTTVTFWLMYLYHCTIGWVHILIVPACDNFFIALIIHVYGQFIILRLSLENIQDQVAALLPGAEDTAQLRREVKLRLGNCITLHQTILEYLGRLEMVMNPVMMSQFFCTTIVLCTCAFQIAMVPTTPVKMVSSLSYMLGGMMQLGMYCFFADRIKEESDGVGYSAYFSRWYDTPSDFKRSVGIVMCRTQRVSALTIGKFVELSLDTYATILKSSYTYFTLLSEFND